MRLGLGVSEIGINDIYLIIYNFGYIYHFLVYKPGRPYIPFSSIYNHAGQLYIPFSSIYDHAGQLYIPFSSIFNHVGQLYIYHFLVYIAPRC